ncbi:MAG: type II secretion system F family protein [bacterium]
MHKRPYLLLFGKEEQMLFAKRLALMLRSGVPIVAALSLLGEEARTHSSSHILHTLRETVAAGRPLSAGLAAFRSVFGDLGVHLVEVGETSGSLPEHLERFSQSIKKERALRRKVIGALLYPAIIVAATLGITTLLALYVFPKIIPVFKGFHAALPLSTRLLISLSESFARYGLYILLALMAVVAAAVLLLRVPSIRLAAGRALLRIPLLGTLFREYAVASLARTLGTLLGSGVGVVRAVELAALGTRSGAYRKACGEMAEFVSTGQKVSAAFALEPLLFPPMLAQMLSVGESTGSLSESLLYCADFYEEELDELSKSIAVLIEPVLMIVMGLIVGFVALAIITPIYGITQNLAP